MADNLSANQECFNLYNETLGSTDNFSCKHPVENEEFENLYLFYDPIHLFRNIYNNWQTKKNTKTKITDPITNKEVTGNWSGLIAIYKIENGSLCKLTKLNHATLYPTNFEKQKVTLVLNIFDEKIAAFLELKGCSDTAIILKAVTTLWNCINIKSRDAWFKLNYENRKPFESAHDQRLESILLLGKKFKDMDTSESPYSGRVMCLTQDTSNGLRLTLYGIVSLTKELLNEDFNYISPGSFQSDRLEKEFGSFRQSAEIMNSLALQ